MHTVHYRRWSPPRSSVRVEFPPELLRELRAETLQDHDRGFLYGLRQDNEVRVLAARRAQPADDPRLSGLTLVGVYVSRFRGEVFLTDSDIEHMERLGVPVALVVAGGRAGFFARESDGTLQAVRSHEEFLVADAAAPPAAPPAGSPERARSLRHPAQGPPRPGRWAAAMMGLLIGPVAALAYLHPLLPQTALDVTVHEVSGQLLIGWDPRALEQGGRLEITDHGDRTVLQLANDAASVTYVTAGGVVDVQLITPHRTGRARWTGPRYVSRATAPSAATLDDVRNQVDALQRRARQLRGTLTSRAARVADLTRQTEVILAK